MPNIASVLKDEITRLARKELRSETESLKKASAQYRSEIAALKRRITALEKQATAIVRKAGKTAAAATPDPTTPVRFSAKGLRVLRQRLGLSANDFGRLLDVSTQTIYNWEAETTRPRQSQIVAIAGLRKIGKKEAAARLAEASPVAPEAVAAS